MTPASPAPPAPRRTAQPLLIGLLVVLALSGWVAALIAHKRDKRPESRSGPGAVVVFHVARTAPAVLPERAADAAESESYRTAQSALLRRRLTLNAVLKQPGVAQLGVIRAQADPLAWLDDNLRVSFDTPELMRVEIDGEPVEELRIILEALAKVYLTDVDERDNGARRERIRKLEETHRAYRADLERFKKQIDNIARVLGSSDGSTLATMDAYLKEEFRDANRELSAVRNQLQLLEAEKGGDGPRVLAPVPWLRTAQLLEAEKGGDEVKQLAAREQLAKREALAKARVNDIQKRIEKHSEYRLELENLKSMIAQTEKLSGSLAETIERLKIELGAPPRVTLADEPHVRRLR